MPQPTIAVLFVCLGNICRSPLAEALFRDETARAGLGNRFRIDSAGTSNYHRGEPPDARTAAVAAKRGVQLRGKSRPITEADLASFDHVIAIDAENRRAVEALRNGGGAEVRLLREFDAGSDGDLDVPDPYFGGPRGFEDVHDLVARSVRGLLAHLRAMHGL